MRLERGKELGVVEAVIAREVQQRHNVLNLRFLHRLGLCGATRSDAFCGGLCGIHLSDHWEIKSTL
jgi:hypothetical protein